jgi:hypothetical protein
MCFYPSIATFVPPVEKQGVEEVITESKKGAAMRGVLGQVGTNPISRGCLM